MPKEKAVAGDPENVPCLKQKKSCSFEQLFNFTYVLVFYNFKQL